MFSRVLPTAFAIALLACAAHHSSTDDTDADLAQDGSDTSSIENDTETMTTSFVAPAGATLGLATAGDLGGGTMQLDDVGDAVRGAYVPAGCATVTSDTTNHVATYTFNGCSGPYGLASVTGTVKVTYANPEPAHLVLDFVGTGLRVNNATADWTAHADIKASAVGRRDMLWTAKLTGETARHKPISRTNQKRISWSVGGECVTVNGASDGQVGNRGVHTDIIAYSRCKGECPAAGSEIRIVNTENAREIDITYDGGRTATYTAANGVQSTVTLACGL
jgi:hypothetical protein